MPLGKWPDWRYRHPLLARAVDDLAGSRRPATRLIDQHETDEPHGPIFIRPGGKILSVR